MSMESKKMEKEMLCPESDCHTPLNADGTCGSLSCKRYGEKIAEPIKSTASIGGEMEIKKQEKTETREITTKEAGENHPIIDLFLISLDRNLKEITKNELTIKSSQEDIEKLPLKFRPIFKENLLWAMKNDLARLSFNDYQKEDEIISGSKNQISEPIKKLLAEIDSRFIKSVKIASEKEYQEKLEFIGKSLATEIFNKLKSTIIDKIKENENEIIKESLRNSNKDINKIRSLSSEITSIKETYKNRVLSEMEKTIKNKITEENIYSLDEIESLLKTTSVCVSALFLDISLLNIKKKDGDKKYLENRLKKITDIKEDEKFIKKQSEKTEYKEEENKIISAMIQLFPEIIKKILEEERSKRP